MQAYYFATQHKLTPMRKYPELSDHYHPSEKPKNGEIIFTLRGLELLGYIMYKMYKSFLRSFFSSSSTHQSIYLSGWHEIGSKSAFIWAF